MGQVSLRSVSKSYGSAMVIPGVSLDIAEGEFVVFVGPSGCGKSTLLRMIAGLEDITGGEVRIGGKRVNDVAARDRGVAMVFQNYALYPHMSVRENMVFGLQNLGTSKAEIAERLSRAVQILQLEPYLDRKPRALSGGQRQRVAIGRAIVREPQVFLFDEPLSNLDAALRVQMRTEIAKLHHRLGATMIYVTHDQTEAMTMADRIVVLRAGLIEQVGTPIELYERPANSFVAGFLGAPKINLIPGVLTGVRGADAAVDLAGARVPVRITGGAEGDKVTLGLRPDVLVLQPEGPIPATVDVVEELGNVKLIYATLPGGHPVVAELRSPALPKVGDAIRLALGDGQRHVFDAEGRAITLHEGPRA
ncbi:MAG: sn-glycerol-3-phosphate ABC transporter ATP-binding protein UgpC [Tabrizicola sp.]|nr:sn-glycerol-3-phosphate ABC transporter ATP-binding protein UgpC [Tabrizicola sp.]